MNPIRGPICFRAKPRDNYLVKFKQVVSNSRKAPKQQGSTAEQNKNNSKTGGVHQSHTSSTTAKQSEEVFGDIASEEAVARRQFTGIVHNSDLTLKLIMQIFIQKL